MRFQVPQFIEHEPKVVGPFTFRQFVYLAIPGGIAFAIFYMIPFSFFLPIAVVLGAVGFAFAFGKSGGRSLPQVLMNALSFGISPKNYTWAKGRRTTSRQTKEYTKQTAQETGTPKQKINLVQGSKVQNLTTKIETKRVDD